MFRFRRLYFRTPIYRNRQKAPKTTTFAVTRNSIKKMIADTR